ncbi:HAMP domain-containing histidine kinase [Gordonia sp. HY002]|uniref:sensor histidine kinase n=1 Tax=Gordonia zhenghanii TaxID=2911516 RepID=UPI001EEFD3AD|nr:HAMP domain-containing sensor histidine kinase [Gordonia zhenghanii]MCF8570079.1 HAMP domain-containing histidine kinase [Gordonia zhenghanii]MCF8605190.1 HAMP domain-containing histidine kinase [Gordonia zhenghanii]
MRLLCGQLKTVASRSGFAPRLFIAQTLVIAAGASIAALVAWAVAPQLFHTHLEHAGLSSTSSQAHHVEEAFTSSLIVSVSVALLSSVVLALVVSWLITRLVERSIGAVVTSTANIAAGNHTVRVPPSRLGREFSDLTGSVNQLAIQLDTSEEVRQQMLSDLAHELRTPITTIAAQVEAAEDGIRVPGEQMYSVIRGAADRLKRLADDIDAVSLAGEKQLRTNPEPTAVNDIVTAAIREAQTGFDNAGVTLTVGSTVPDFVDADRARIGQTLANLLSNALRHTPSGGTVTVSSHRRNNNQIDITVKDNGDGIAADHLPHIFDRFYRTDTSRSRDAGGSGIGLTIARALAEAHGGTLIASSRGTGHGATFTMILPKQPPKRSPTGDPR